MNLSHVSQRSLAKFRGDIYVLTCFGGMPLLLLNNKRLTTEMTICNGNRTEWSPIRSVIIRVITKSDDRAAGVRFVYHEYDYRPNCTTRSPIAN